MAEKRISGTLEWSTASVNCVTGCSHDCRYCYARAMALQYGRIKRPGDWARMQLRPKEVARGRRKVEGTVMFPTTHDITPETLKPCLEVIGKILSAGNRLLIVSKPHSDCIAAILQRFPDERDRILFRFTIGGISEGVLRYWEPGAPMLADRTHALWLAHYCGFATSVSCEPLLESDRAVELVEKVAPFVTDTIWIGKMNQVRPRAVPGTSEEAIRRIEAGQTADRVREVYEELKDHPKIRWKESYKRVLGLAEAQSAGMDV